MSVGSFTFDTINFDFLPTSQEHPKALWVHMRFPPSYGAFQAGDIARLTFRKELPNPLGSRLGEFLKQTFRVVDIDGNRTTLLPIGRIAEGPTGEGPTGEGPTGWNIRGSDHAKWGFVVEGSMHLIAHRSQDPYEDQMYLRRSTGEYTRQPVVWRDMSS